VGREVVDWEVWEVRGWVGLGALGWVVLVGVVGMGWEEEREREVLGWVAVVVRVVVGWVAQAVKAREVGKVEEGWEVRGWVVERSTRMPAQSWLQTCQGRRMKPVHPCNQRV
jgi:hypothetical protein